MRRKSLVLAVTMGVAAGAASGARSTETITYRYDARGRLISVVHAGSVNDGVAASYAHDKADNRVSKTVTGAP